MNTISEGRVEVETFAIPSGQAAEADRPLEIAREGISPLPLFLISALHESGGGFLHRLFDGHPELKVYPFEMQLGSRLSKDNLKGYCFQERYRWPNLPNEIGSYETLHRLILNEEVKGYLENPEKSKYSGFHLKVSPTEWVHEFGRRLKSHGGKVSRATVLESYLTSFFLSWANRTVSKGEWAILGHCPILFVDADKVLCDFPAAKFVHLIRHPLSTFYDTKKRLPHLKLKEFAQIWNLCAYLGFYYRSKYPEHFLTLRYEDLLSKPTQALKSVCRFLGISYQKQLRKPSWNGTPLNEVKPFGGIPTPSQTYESKIRRLISQQVRSEIFRITCQAQGLFGYHPQELP